MLAGAGCLKPFEPSKIQSNFANKLTVFITADRMATALENVSNALRQLGASQQEASITQEKTSQSLNEIVAQLGKHFNCLRDQELTAGKDF